MSTEGTAATQRPRAYGYCSWHQGYAWGTRLVQLTDQGSGPGDPGRFACPSCRVAYDLVPLADQS
ncbi:hypothetical protein [Streptomyces acidicola]|uniref:hypothetical protein n=1 Tax=Streptomyces acidicola TaxID=2596892 RepID=UPI00344744F9